METNPVSARGNFYTPFELLSCKCQKIGLMLYVGTKTNMYFHSSVHTYHKSGLRNSIQYDHSSRGKSGKLSNVLRTATISETFDTIVSVSKLRYYCPKVSYRYRISIEILYLKSISIGIGIEISDIKVSVSVSVSPFNILGIKLCISTIFTPQTHTIWF